MSDYLKEANESENRWQQAESEARFAYHALIFLHTSSLTAKERLIAWFLLQGLCNKDIAERMGNSSFTIKGHLHAIFRKLSADSRQEVFARVFPIGEDVPQELIDALPNIARRKMRGQ